MIEHLCDDGCVREIQAAYARRIHASIQRAKEKAFEHNEIDRLSVLRGMERLEGIMLHVYVGSIHIESFFGAAKTRPRWIAGVLVRNNIERLSDFLEKPLTSLEQMLKDASIVLPVCLKTLHIVHTHPECEVHVRRRVLSKSEVIEPLWSPLVAHV